MALRRLKGQALKQLLTADDDIVAADFNKLADTTASAATLNAAVIGVAAGYKIARGTQIATATELVATGLTTVVASVAAPLGTTATAANTAVVLSSKNAGTAGSINVYRWKHTAPSTATLIASTTAGTINWLAVGT